MGVILEPYDPDKLFPVFGFGGIPKYIPEMFEDVQHCFPLNGNLLDPHINGLGGILYTYRTNLTHI